MRHPIRHITFVTAMFVCACASAGEGTPNSVLSLENLQASKEILDLSSEQFEELNDFQEQGEWENLPQSARDFASGVSRRTPEQVNDQLAGMQQIEGEVGVTFNNPDLAPQDSMLGTAPQSGMQDQSETISRLLPDSGQIRYIVYLSFSMPDALFADVVRAINARDDAAGVIQGLLEPHHTIPDTVAALYQRLEEIGFERDQAPSLYIDSELFTEFDVTNVPKIIRFDGETPTISIKGLPNIDYLARQFDQGQRGSLGVQGNLYEIQEENFIEMVKRRAGELDGDKLVDQTVSRFWNGQQMHPLPMANETNSYLVDLTITVEQDIITPQGHAIARAGDRINPLDQIPFNRVGIIFDGTEKAQLDWAIEQAQEALSNNNAPIMMTTRIDHSEDGWANYEHINEHFPMGLKLLDHMIINRFDIQHAPSKFEQHGRYIKVTEVALDEQ